MKVYTMFMDLFVSEMNGWFADEGITGFFLIQILTSVVCGFLIGFERKSKGKSVGLKTSMLICFGSMLFTKAGLMIQGGTADPTRVAAQIVSGIGFLGAGAILIKGDMVVGLTSAALVWFTAAVGVLVGIERIGMAIIVTFSSLIAMKLGIAGESFFIGNYSRKNDGENSENGDDEV